MDRKVFNELKTWTEQYALQELLCSQDIPVAYWEADGGTAEVGFVAQMGNLVVPIEVKAGVNLRARSLASYKISNGMLRSAESAHHWHCGRDWTGCATCHSVPSELRKHWFQICVR